jgi:23S rRNA (guanosine2251-2'-O)-methyltransferase
MIEHLLGRNAVLEALVAGRRRPQRLLIEEQAAGKEASRQAIEAAHRSGLPVELVDHGSLDRWGKGHQGLALEAEGYPYASLIDILDRAAVQHEPPFLLLLDLIQDPQNFGTLLRTAEQVGVHGVLIPPRKGVAVTPAVVRASAGASEHMLIARHNLAQSIADLKRQGVWIYGLDLSPSAHDIDDLDLSGPAALVVGSEASGMRRLVSEACDRHVRLPMRGRLDSLNASVAGSLALYLIWRQRGYPGRV